MLICLLLALITLALYWPATHFDFINYDDPEYIIYNAPIQHGITGAALVWAFKTSHASNWHPLTWISHMADCALYGLNPGGHHLTNLLFHTLNVILLFLVLRQWTGAPWRSALVAALFAWHPLHVESVAWVSERKDVLSAFFWLLTMAAYGRYTENLKFQISNFKYYYIVALLFFAFALMAKPMAVTLPFVLLLLDIWPLRRTAARGLFREKVPFFALAALDCVATLWAQRGGNSVVSLGILPLPARIANALVSYVLYLWKMLWPAGLAVPYLLLPYLDILAGGWSGLLVAAHFHDRNSARAAPAIPRSRLVLVPGNACTGDWSGAGRLPTHGRPLHLRAAYRDFYHGGLGHSRRLDTLAAAGTGLRCGGGGRVGLFAGGNGGAATGTGATAWRSSATPRR